MYRTTVACLLLLLLIVGKGLARSKILDNRDTGTEFQPEVEVSGLFEEKRLDTENAFPEEPVFQNEIERDVYDRENEMNNEVKGGTFAGNEILTDESIREIYETEYSDILSHNQTEEEVGLYNPGFKARVSQKGLDYARDVAIEIAMRELSNLQIPDVEESIAGMDVAMSNIRMIHLQEPQAEITTIPGIGLSLRASGIEPVIEADYEATFDMWFYTINKTGSVRVTGRNIFLDLQFYIGRTFDGKPDISVYDCDAQGLIFFYFEGGWSDTLNFAVSLGQENLRNLILAQICANARKEIEEAAAMAMENFTGLVKGSNHPEGMDTARTCNCKLSVVEEFKQSKGLGKSIEFQGDQLVDAFERAQCRGVTYTFEDMFELDFGLIRFPAFYEEALETFHKGEITLVGVSQPPPFEAPEMATFHNHTSKMIYVYVTDYLLNSGLYAAYSSGMLAYNVSGDNIPEEARGYLSTSCTLSLCLGTLFPELSEQYPDGEAFIQLYATDCPRVDFIEDVVAVTAAGNAEVFIDTGESRAHILTIYVNITAAFSLAMQGQRLTFDLINIRPEAVIAHSTLEETEGAEFFFDTMIRLATQQFLVPKLIELGEEGVVIPELPQISLVDPEITLDPEVPHVIVLSTDVTLDTSTF